MVHYKNRPQENISRIQRSQLKTTLTTFHDWSYGRTELVPKVTVIAPLPQSHDQNLGNWQFAPSYDCRGISASFISWSPLYLCPFDCPAWWHFLAPAVLPSMLQLKKAQSLLQSQPGTHPWASTSALIPNDYAFVLFLFLCAHTFVVIVNTY